jgi:hypothetical protein
MVGRETQGGAALALGWILASLQDAKPSLRWVVDRRATVGLRCSAAVTARSNSVG